MIAPINFTSASSSSTKRSVAAAASTRKPAARIRVQKRDPADPESPSTAYPVDGDRSPLGLYLREVGQTALLTLEQEGELARRIEAGDEAAREHMIKANLRLVVKIARDYAHFGLPLMDLINEGNIGLMKAVERFDPTKGAKFSTYSSWWIKQGIKRALANQSKTIRLPVHLVEKLARLNRASLALQDQLGRAPSDEELAQTLDTTPRRVGMMRRASMRPTSLDAPLTSEDGRDLAETVPDEKAETGWETMDRKIMLELLEEVLPTLDPRERTILCSRFGLEGARVLTLEEIGHKFGVTRERIRQLQNLALSKLRERIEERDAMPMVA